MKTPRALLVALLALAASVARAGDPTIIFLPRSGDSGVADFSRPQNGADWRILHIERNEAELPIIRLAPRGTQTSGPITLVNPYDEYFIIPAGSVLMGSGVTTVLSVSKDPYPGAMRGEPIRLVGPGGQPTGPELWLPSRRETDIRDQLNFWPIPADNTRVDRQRTIILPRDRFAPDNALQPPSWFTLPGQRPRDVLSPLLGGTGSSNLFTFPGQTALPPTFYTAVTNYRYDARKKKLIGADGREKAVTVMNMPAGSFFLAPPALPADFRIPGLTFVNSRGETVDTRRGAQPPASDGRREFKKPSWAGNWKDKITHIHKWHAVETAQSPIPAGPSLPMTFYCYHETEDGHKNVSGHLKSNYDIVECVDWVIPAKDEVQKAEGKEFRIRHNRVVIDVVYKDKALRRVDTGGPNIVLRDKGLSHAALGGQDYVKVTAVPPPAAAPAASLALLEPDETRWLTRQQADNYRAAREKTKEEAAIKALDAEHRALVEEQTRPEAKAAYASAHAKPLAEAPGKISEAIAKVEMWGGEVKEAVGLFQETPNEKLLEIQLSKEEYEALKKKPAELAAYESVRSLVSGSTIIQADGTRSENATFNKDLFDPVQLRLTVVAARKALAGPAAPAEPSPGAAPVLDTVNLTPEQRTLLTPEELKKYEAQERIANEPNARKETKEALHRLTAELKETIKTRTRYVQPTNADSFAKLENWQKERYCDGLPSPSAVAERDTKDPFVGNQGADSVAGLGNQSSLSAGTPPATTPPATTPPATTPPATSAAWSKEESDKACDEFKRMLATTPGSSTSGGSQGRGSQRTVVPGPDTVGTPVEGNKWVTKPLIQTAVKGALIGLLIGSLFGPIGLIAGPLLGAALFYGMTKYDEIKADNAKKNKPE